MTDDLSIWQEDWSPGARAWFEYHCFESDASGDAVTWHHSHQQVIVAGHDATDHDCLRPLSFLERGEAGMPCVYRIRFADGFEATAFEDELLTDPRGFERPAPPPGAPQPRFLSD